MVNPPYFSVSTSENLNLDQFKIIAKSRNTQDSSKAFAIYEFAYQEYIKVNHITGTALSEEVPYEIISEIQLFSFLIEGQINMYA